MRLLSSLRSGLGVCLLALFIAGCQDNHTQPPATDVVASPELPSEAPVTPQAAGQGASKPTPPIAISYEMIGDPQVGRPMQINVTTRSQAELSDVSFEVHGDARVLVVQSAGNRNAARVPREEAMIRTVTVTPLVEGALSVSVLVQADINGVTQARNIVIPIQVGTVTAVPEREGLLQVDESGELIISLPAQESP